MAGPTSPRQLLRDRAVAAIVSVEALIGLGQGATVTALGWQAYGRSHQPLTLGLLGLAAFVPAAVLALPAGNASDRHDRRVVAGIGLAVMAATTLLLALDAASGDRAVWPLYLLAFAIGISSAYVSPAFDPLLASALPATSLAQGIALSSSAAQAAKIAGPALGGLLQGLGNPVPYLLAAACAAAAALAVAMVPRRVGRAHVAGEEATLSDALAGVRFIFSAPALLGAISLDLMAVLFGGATALIPIFARDILHVGALGNGLLRAAPGAGAVLVGLVLSVHPPRRRVGVTLFVVVATYGVFTVVFGLSRSFALSLAALAALTGADMVSVLVRGTLAPLLTPPALRGRVGAVERVFIGASNELGAFESGVAAALIGAVPAVVLGGLASVAVAAIWAWRFPSLRQIDRFADIEPLEPAPARASP